MKKGMPFVLRVSVSGTDIDWKTGKRTNTGPRYFIVPGVATREEALAVLEEHFDWLGRGNFRKD